MKKLLASVVVMLLLISCCLISAFPTSASDINYDDFWISEDGIIVEYLGAGGDVVVPSVDADGNPITGIDTRAFADNMDITSVVIQEGIETIGYEAFQSCKNLMEVSLPYSLKEADYSTFRDTGITQLVIPAQLKVVPSDFISYSCIDVVISEGVEEIKTGSLKGQFTKFVFPESVYSVGSYFYGGMYTSVKSLEIYFVNPDCEIAPVGKHPFVGSIHEYTGEKITSGVECLVYRYPNASGEIKVYAEKESTIEDYFNEYMKDKDVNCRFIGKDAEFFEKYQKECEDKGIYEPENLPDVKDEDPDDEDGDKSGNKGNSDKDNNGTANAGGIDTTTLIIIAAAFGGFFLLIIVAVVIILVVMGNKKKKKKKKKAKKVAEEAVVAEEVVEAPAEVVEEATEENGEEE